MRSLGRYADLYLTSWKENSPDSFHRTNPTERRSFASQAEERAMARLGAAMYALLTHGVITGSDVLMTVGFESSHARIIMSAS